MPFNISRKGTDPDLIFILSGRFTSRNQDQLSGQITQIGINNQTVTLEIDDNFSIDRSGISGLIRAVEQMRKQNAQVVLNNVSCNFSRLFKMVGMDKLADIHEARAGD
jgi:anti-anti-sigma factor